MDKIWIVKNKRSYAKKFRIYKSESELLKVINIDSDVDILEYNLDNKKSAADFFKERDRDIQLRNILGELNKDEEFAVEFISLYEELATDTKVVKRWGRPDIKYKEIVLNKLKKFQTDKKVFAKFIVDNKKYFFTVSTKIKWYKSILKCHNFRDSIIEKKWDPITKKYIDMTPDEVKENFILAKKELKVKK
jgi:hypothetical protein